MHGEAAAWLQELYQAVPVALAPVLGNPIALAAFGVDRTASLPDQATALAQGLVGLLPQLSALSEILPPPTLAWKLQLLQEGNRCAHSGPLWHRLTPDGENEVFVLCWIGITLLCVC